MNLCDLNCCDLKYLQTKFDAINKKISDNQKLQDKINTNIFKLLKESGIDVETLLKNYYALNEDDYTKTLTSEDDINTLEPGTYKIVKTDMPQNAPTGVVSTEYDGTLILSNSYAILFENGFLHIGNLLTGINKFKWNYVINSNLINIHLQSYMLISKYSDGEFIDDIHTLNQSSTGVYIVNSATQNLPVQQNGIIIVRIGTATNSLFVTFIPEDSFDVYYCAKKANGTWTEWGQVAFMSDVPSLEGYATQEWVNQQIQDITGGSVTADWVKSNFLTIARENYPVIKENADLNTYIKPGTYTCPYDIYAPTVINNPSKYAFTLLVIDSIHKDCKIQILITYLNTFYHRTFYSNKWEKWKRVVSDNELNDMATQTWVQSQKYLTEIPDDYATDTEVSQAIAAALVGYATQAWVNEQISEITGGAVTSEIVSQMISDAIVGYATQSWVKERGYQTATQVSATITAALTGYATQTWVEQKEYTTVTYSKENFLSLEKDLYIEIQKNSDLNNYTTKGCYYSINSNITKTLSNIPNDIQWGFKLTIEEISSSKYLTQKITENITGNIYVRILEETKGWHDWERIAYISDLPNLSNYASQEWVQQQGYQTVQQVNSLIKNATADMLTQEDLKTFNYATENWVLQTALKGYAKESWVNTKLNNYLPKKQEMSLTTQGTYYGLQYQWARYGQVVEVFLVGNLTQQISNQLISNFCPANPMRTLQTVIPGYNDTKHYAEFNNDGLKLMGSYQNELYINCHFTYLTNE